MNSFMKAIVFFSRDAADRIETALHRWATGDDLGREIVKNINPLERFLPKEDMRELLEAIRRCESGEFAELADSYEHECHRHTLSGGRVRGRQPILLGRAVERSTFVMHLYRVHWKYFGTEQNVEDFIDRLRVRDSMSPYESKILMSSFAAWVTWDELSDGDPFSFLESGTAEEIRACLGLDFSDRWRNKPILLFVYKRSAGLELNRPTIADAGLYRFFEPPPVGREEHGWTRTWYPGMSKVKFRLKPRPEAVHACEPMGHLVLPLRELR
jgi:hypothetical protein